MNVLFYFLRTRPFSPRHILFPRAAQTCLPPSQLPSRPCHAEGDTCRSQMELQRDSPIWLNETWVFCCCCFKKKKKEKKKKKKKKAEHPPVLCLWGLVLRHAWAGELRDRTSSWEKNSFMLLPASLTILGTSSCQHIHILVWMWMPVQGNDYSVCTCFLGLLTPVPFQAP